MSNRILVTGGKGFLGGYVLQALPQAESLGRSELNDIRHDISKSVSSELKDYNVVIHCAGKAHSIPKSEQEEREFFTVNEQGTKNLLSSLSAHNMQMFVLISTVAVYGLDIGEEITEENPILANSPYAKSKRAAELLVQEWCKSNNVDYVVLRLPLVYGLDAPGNLESMRKAMQKGYYFRIGKGQAHKSIISANAVADFISFWIQLDNKYSGIYNLTSSTQPTVAAIEDQVAEDYQLKKPRSIPAGLIKMLAKVGDMLRFLPINSAKYNKLISDLTFSSSKLRSTFSWTYKGIFG